MYSLCDSSCLSNQVLCAFCSPYTKILSKKEYELNVIVVDSSLQISKAYWRAFLINTAFSRKRLPKSSSIVLFLFFYFSPECLFVFPHFNGIQNYSNWGSILVVIVKSSWATCSLLSYACLFIEFSELQFLNYRHIVFIILIFKKFKKIQSVCLAPIYNLFNHISYYQVVSCRSSYFCCWKAGCSCTNNQIKSSVFS